MGRLATTDDTFSLRIVIGEAEVRASSVDDVVRFLHDRDAGDLADLLLAQQESGTPPPRALSDFCARMEVLCALA